MRYRKLDANGDYSFGHGPSDFFRNVPDAPAQAVFTRLHMRQGEWFLNVEDGTPWDTKVLGRYTENTRDLVVRGRVLDTEGVLDIIEYSSAVDRNTRDFAVQIRISTVYGDAYLNAKPEPI